MTRHTRKLTSPRAGELPLAIGQLKANGCKVYLNGNNGFTLSSDISAVKDATKLDFSSGCYLSGACRGMTRHTARGSELRTESRAGTLPMMPPSLEVLNMCNAGNFTGGIPSEWGLLTNLKELNMDNCGLDGASLWV